MAKYASFHPYFLPIQEHPINTDRGYKEITIDVAPPATVSFARGIPPGHRAAFYFPGTKKTLAFAIPAPPGTPNTTLPADLPFMPVLISDDGHLRFGELHPAAKPGTRIVIDDFDRPATKDVVAYLRRPRELAASATGELPPPRIRLVADGRTYAAQLPHGPARSDDLIVIKNVESATGSAVLQLSGSTWESAETPLRVTGRTKVDAAPPVLRLAPAAALRLRADPPVVEWLQGLVQTTCSGARTKETVGERPNTLELWCENGACARPYSLPIDNLWSDAGATFEGIPAGAYELRIRTSRTPDAWRKTLQLSLGMNDVALDVPLSLVIGKVTRDDRPVHARISLADGTALTGVDGGYAVRFSRKADRIAIRECATDAQFLHVPELPLDGTAQVDIELPAPAVVRVTDGTSSQPIANATIRVMVADPEEKGSFVVNEVAGRTGPDGLLALPRTPLVRFGVCARADDYAPACESSDAGTPIQVTLTRVETLTGRIEGVSGVRGGMLFFVTPDGVEIEGVEVDADGQFQHRLRHGADRYAVFVSVSHRLAVMRIPPVAPLRLTFPAQALRDIAIRTPPDADYEVGLSVGNVVVPWAAFSRHQSFRGRLPYATKGEMVIPAVVESAPLTVFLGFRVGQRPPHVSPRTDPFSTPELRRAFPSAVAGRDPVVFR